MRVILASKSPARLDTLRSAGIYPDVVVSGVDEEGITADTIPELTRARAQLKGQAVLGRLELDEVVEAGTTIILACDSLLEVAGQTFGKPGTEAAAIARWYRLRGQRGILHTGHHVIVVAGDGSSQSATRVASTTVTFADLTDAEIAAYAATGEPQRVAGAFTLDGHGGAFVTRIEGDPHNVVGISLPLVRQMLLDLGISWTSLWAPIVPREDD
ncbi:Maf family protein [Aestuariimicrobium ganziense]|uniref:Maf family protein n=1 Tax=Aestuariimicrobium ganziense TaxID=2773677 RepID=UPI0019419D3C|nr:Maf family protein [Aestuariimicrobium ganziense]